MGTACSDLHNDTDRDRTPSGNQRISENKGRFSSDAEVPTLPTIMISELSPKREWTFVAKGGFGAVSKAIYKDKQVVVKQLLKLDDRSKADFEKELWTTTFIQGIRGVVKAYGKGVDDEGNDFLVLEVVDIVIGKFLGKPLSDKKQYDADNRQADSNEFISLCETSTDIEVDCCSLTRKLDYALEIGLKLADVLSTLHNSRVGGENVAIMHRDLKPDNFGIMSNGQMCLFDFGVSRIDTKPGAAGSSDDAPLIDEMTGNVGTLRYMAPEVYANKDYDTSSEVYSWALNMWVLTSHKVPFAGVRDFPSEVYQGGKRPKLEFMWPKPLNDLLKSCWNFDPSKRPTMKQVVEAMTKIIDSRKKK